MNLKQLLIYNISVFFIFLLFFLISDYLYFQFTREIALNFGIEANLIYLPHGVRVLSFLVFGLSIIPGLILGQFTSGIFFKCQESLDVYEILIFCNLDFNTLIVLFIGAVLTLISLLLSYYLLKFNLVKNLNQVSIFKILNFIFLSSILNSLFSNLFFGLIYGWNLALNTALYIIGDAIGALALFYLIKLFLKIKFYYR